MTFEETKKELNALENEYAETKLNFDILRERYKKLARKYWGSQRLVGMYARDEADMSKLNRFWRKRYIEACDELQRCDELVLENIRLRNRLTIDRIKAKKDKDYLRAYQDLYISEVKKNREMGA